MPNAHAQPLATKTDKDVLREHFQFLRDDQADEANDTWEVRFAKKYHDRLFKEYALADLSRYRESKIGFRWRTEKELVAGKGQFSCGSLSCAEYEGLESFEVNFSYREGGEVKQALVKLRVCPACAYKLNYRAIKRLHQTLRRARREAERQAEGDEEEGREKKRSRRRSRSRSREREESSRPMMRGGTLGAMVRGGDDQVMEEEEPREGEREDLLRRLVDRGEVKVPRASSKPRAADFFREGDEEQLMEALMQ